MRTVAATTTQRRLIASRIHPYLSIALLFQTAHQEPSTHTRNTSMNTFNSSSRTVLQYYAGGERLRYYSLLSRTTNSARVFHVIGRQLNVVGAHINHSYSYPLVSIAANRHVDGRRSTVLHACCFYATCGARHTSKTYRVHQVTALFPRDGQQSRTYIHIFKLVHI